ncbi:IAA-alanine resistance protein 1 [Triticum urartu]|uniref:IAA-alanine resistance protein 1 n=1 Tax=Triticum urartu TaxID=4572 RepID=M8A078_TRIUA|nr:IAA-alanine resistance protein 1 [Triticum urartu]
MLCRLLSLLLLAALLAAAAGHGDSSASSCPFHGGHDEEPHEHHDHGHSCGGALDDSNHEHHHHHSHHHRDEIQRLLPEELAEEADLELEGFDHDHHHHHDHHHDHIHRDFQPESTPMGVLRHDTTDNFGDLAGVWLRAMGCSLLVSMASLVCLILLPVILFQGKPSKAVVDALAVFGVGAELAVVRTFLKTNIKLANRWAMAWSKWTVMTTLGRLDVLAVAQFPLRKPGVTRLRELAAQAGAMLGDSFLHQLPHAFGGGHSHSHNHEDHDHAHEQSHAHSLKDLSVGLSILFGIVLFFIVEKIVRYVEDNSQRGGHSHGHHHHHHKRQDISDKAKSGHIKSDDEGKDTDQVQQNSLHDGATGKMIDAENEQESNATKVYLILVDINSEGTLTKHNKNDIRNIYNYLLLVKDEEIKHRWREYFDKLFNGENESSTIELDDSFDETSMRFVRRIQESEVKVALKRMKGGKAMGLDCIPIEVWKGLGDIAIVWLTKLFNLIFRANKMPGEWRRSILVPIFKNKGDVQSCSNYRGIKLMSHTMKLWERVIEHRLRRMTSVTKNQFGFMPGRSTMEAIFLEAVLGSQRSGLDVVPGATDREPINSETNPAPGKTLSSEDPSVSNSNLVFGYLNLFSDGVHNFTDGMALGSAFLLHGSVGGWSRTLFLLAHELPQEIGDFGILVRSGFTVTKALFFNFLSALVALGGTALALSLGTDPGHSSLIEIRE